MKKRWLIVSYFASVDPMASSHHIDDRLPFFRQKGIDICLLTSPCGVGQKSFLHVRVPSPMPSGIRYEVRSFLRRRTRSKVWFKFWEILLLLPVYPLYFLEKALFRLDSTWSWFMTASIAAVILSLKNKPEIIYSTGGPVSTHVAAMTASRLLKIPHIAEFQDPLVHEHAAAAPGKLERLFMREMERRILGNSAAAVFLTKKAAENAALRHPECRSTAAIYAGAVPRKGRVAYEKTEQFNISHFGSLAGTRNLDHLFGALRLLIHDQPGLGNTIRLNLYGSNDREVRRQIEQFPCREVLSIHGKVKRQEALDTMFRTDVLLLIQNTDDVSFETIPSKVYEYLHTGRPILALVYGNPELQAMLQEMGHIVVQADDSGAIRKGLEIYVEQWKQGRLQSLTSVSPYTVSRAVDELISLADGL